MMLMWHQQIKFPYKNRSSDSVHLSRSDADQCENFKKKRDRSMTWLPNFNLRAARSVLPKLSNGRYLRPMGSTMNLDVEQLRGSRFSIREPRNQYTCIISIRQT